MKPLPFISEYSGFSFGHKNINIKIDGLLTLVFFVCVCRESCCPELREGHRLRRLGNMLLRKTFRPKWEEETRDLIKLHRVSSRFILLDKSDIIRVLERIQMRNMYRILV
jgi:hypothetical protein